MGFFGPPEVGLSQNPSPLWGGVGVGVERLSAGVDGFACVLERNFPPHPPPQGGRESTSELNVQLLQLIRLDLGGGDPFLQLR